jgi:serine/threonine-protein kinase
MIGATLGKYRIVGQLGRGGMGIVYRAIDATLDREVAIKVLNPEMGDSDVLRRFRAEAVTLARLNHPGIATIFELAESEHGLLMVMELVRGESLDRLAARVGTLPPERAAYIVVRVLRALEYAHRAGVVHRDLKPGNVMVTEDGGVKVMDFGVARVRDTAHVTAAGHMVGTPAYMAPEQVRGEEVDGRADLYSVGVVLYRLLAGALPFRADTAIAMAQKQLTDSPTPIGLLQAGLPAWCDPVLVRALAKAPAERFQTAAEFGQALAHAVPAAVDDTGDATWYGHMEATTPSRPVAAPATRGATQHGVAAPVAPAAPIQATAASGASPGPPSVPGDTTVVLRARHLAAAGILLAMLAVVAAVLAVIVLREPAGRPGKGVAESSPSPPSATVPPGAPPTAAQPSAAGTGAPAAAAAPMAAAPVSPGPGQAPAATPGPATPGPVVRGPAAPRRSTTVRANAPPSSPGDTPLGNPTTPAAQALPSLTVDARMLTAEGEKARETDIDLVLGPDAIELRGRGNGDALQTVPYGRIMSVSYTKGRDPLWRSPGGPALVLRADGGALGIFRGERHWLAVRTRDRFVVVRVEGRDASRVIAALEARTGRTVDRVSGPASER